MSAPEATDCAWLHQFASDRICGVLPGCCASRLLLVDVQASQHALWIQQRRACADAGAVLRRYKNGDRGQTYHFTRVCGQETSQEQYFGLTAASMVCHLQSLFEIISDGVTQCSAEVCQERRQPVGRWHFVWHVFICRFASAAGHARLSHLATVVQVRELLTEEPCSSVVMAYGISAAGKTFTIEVGRRTLHHLCAPLENVSVMRARE